MPIKQSIILVLFGSFLHITSCSVKKSDIDQSDQVNEPSINEQVATEEYDESKDESTEEIANTFTDQYGNTIYTKVDQKPAFEGGEEALYDFLSSHLKYPKKALEKNAEGTVLVVFIVSKDGTIRNVELANGLDESSLNLEAMRVVSEMPNWIPGVQDGEQVNVKYTLPVRFQLDHQN
ncbi:MAG: energy transducer TonB [Cyclobacteriaceae bacterium]|nr:energy transducer TonB [Cyclobacteriaceae bacterium]